MKQEDLANHLDLRAAMFRKTLDGEGVVYQGFIGWGGRHKKQLVRTNLGESGATNARAGWGKKGKIVAWRRVPWDLAMGYVSGYPIRDIIWYTLSRNFSPKWRKQRREVAARRATD